MRITRMPPRATPVETPNTHCSTPPVRHSSVGLPCHSHTTRRGRVFSPNDPRYYQIVALSSLLFYGAGWLEFDIAWPQILISLGTALIAQYACSRIFGLPSFDPRSPLISGLSLCLLLRTNSLIVAFLTALASITSKFLLKYRGKHIFNPTNFGIVAMMLLTNRLWVSPAQWGSKLYFAFLIACAGGLIIYRAARSDVTYAFLISYAAILFGRALWLGDPSAIPLKQLQSGALLLFAFYMISDPKTTPDSRAGRMLFAFLVTLGAAYVQFGLYQTNGLLWSLALFSTLTPLIDHVLPGMKYEWNHLAPAKLPTGESHEKSPLDARPVFHSTDRGYAGS
jgi:enediyne biosynthesis protein E5